MLRFVTAGESHGAAIAALVEGIPAGLAVDTAFIDGELRRRQGGYGRGGRMAIESDRVTVLSGLRGGKTLGSPILLQILNKDARLESLAPVTQPRPGHADLAGALKYGTHDARDVLERASARETAARVMAGAVCSLFLREFGIELAGFVASVGEVDASLPDWHALAESKDGGLAAFKQHLVARNASPFYLADAPKNVAAEAAMREAVDQARRDGDTLGGVVEVVALGLPPGLGNCTQWDRKLDAQLAQALTSIQAIKGVEIGLGFEAARRRGSAVHDPILPASPGGGAIRGTKLWRGSNVCGGLEGGMTTGTPLVIRAAMKPISTLMQPLMTVDLVTGQAVEASKERSDICAVPAASVVCQHAAAVPIAAAFLDKFGGDSMTETRRNFDGYLASLGG